MSEDKIIYLPIDTPLDKLQLASAFNIPEADPLRRAIDQTLKKMREEANAAMPEAISNPGNLAYAVGFEQALSEVIKELDKCYNWAHSELCASAQNAAPAKSKGY